MDADPAVEAPAYLVPAVDRALRILELLREEGREMGVVEVATATGWHKSTVQKILVTLNHHGVVERNPQTRRYSLGMALAEFGRAVLNQFDIRPVAKPILRELMEASGETAVLGVLREDRVVMIDKSEPHTQMRVSPFLGVRYPATETAHGKALLAWLPEQRQRELCETAGLAARTPKSIIDLAGFLKDLAATRRRGYAEEYDEFQEGVSGVAAPVFARDGRVVGTLSVVGPSSRMSRTKMKQSGRLCVERAAELGGRLAG